MENWLYLGIEFTDFDSKTRFGKDINFFQDVLTQIKCLISGKSNLRVHLKTYEKILESIGQKSSQQFVWFSRYEEIKLTKFKVPKIRKSIIDRVLQIN